MFLPFGLCKRAAPHREVAQQLLTVPRVAEQLDGQLSERGHRGRLDLFIGKVTQLDQQQLEGRHVFGKPRYTPRHGLAITARSRPAASSVRPNTALNSASCGELVIEPSTYEAVSDVLTPSS